MNEGRWGNLPVLFLCGLQYRSENVASTHVAAGVSRFANSPRNFAIAALRFTLDAG